MFPQDNLKRSPRILAGNRRTRIRVEWPVLQSGPMETTIAARRLLGSAVSHSVPKTGSSLRGRFRLLEENMPIDTCCSGSRLTGSLLSRIAGHTTLRAIVLQLYSTKIATLSISTSDTLHHPRPAFLPTSHILISWSVASSPYTRSSRTQCRNVAHL